MQPAGLFVMLASVGTVTALFGWCIWQVLTQPAGEIERLGGVEFDTPDADRR